MIRKGNDAQGQRETKRIQAHSRPCYDMEKTALLPDWIRTSIPPSDGALPIEQQADVICGQGFPPRITGR